eukprot:TRINITY_DN3973_c0_g2_i2.p1 TRINITY_DN3973_c0_g2~~TRINITY_DN3973_c0_g2_i2.p1  ORF type:complete len:492 (-),score=70.68 TRINITY_DN3973_c0_g2_i2:2583-4058(-)
MNTIDQLLELAGKENSSSGQKVRILRNKAHLFVQQGHQLQDLLNAVDPSTNTLACISILSGFINSKAFSNGNLKEVFINGVEGFVQNCNLKDLRHMYKEFNEIFRGYKSKIMDRPKRGLRTLLCAYQKLRESQQTENNQQQGNLLTLIHVDLFQLSLMSKFYNVAIEAVSEDALDMDPAQTGITPTDFQLYCYYGGRICIGLKMYGRALELFRFALEAPTHVLNSITVDVYKKYVLIHLMHIGTRFYMPKYASTSLQRYLRNSPAVKPYNDLMEAFVSENITKIESIISFEEQALVMDGNLGLVKLLPDVLLNHKIKKLTDTYLTLSLDEIAKQVGLPSPAEAESRLRSLIEKGDIQARIDSFQGMVLFIDQQLATVKHQNGAVSNGPQTSHASNGAIPGKTSKEEQSIFTKENMLRDLKAQLLQYKDLATQLGVLQQNVLTDKAYQGKVMQRQRQQQKSQEGGEDDDGMDPAIMRMAPDVPGASESFPSF